MGKLTEADSMEQKINETINNSKIKKLINEPNLFVGTVTFELLNLDGVKNIKLKKHQHVYIFNIHDENGNVYNASYSEPTLHGPILKKD